jgi:NADPH-dependent curcumin reductase CurA
VSGSDDPSNRDARVHEGKITWKETIEDGIENAPTAFLKLFKGENFGKMLVKLR